MAMFERQNRSTRVSYHSYITESPTLHNIGLASYNRNILNKFGDAKRNDIDVYFGKFEPLKPKLLGDTETLEMLKFDTKLKKYKLATSTSKGENNIFYSPSGGVDGIVYKTSGLLSFQEDFDLYQKGFIKNEIQKFNINHIWSNIQNSLSGCLTFQINYNVLGSSAQSKIRLYFQSSGKNKTSRQVGLKGSPIIVDVPRTPAGTRHGLPIGSNSFALPAANGNNNPANTVAGELHTSYNVATGKFESGTTQILVRVLEDIRGFPQPSFPLDPNAMTNTQYQNAPKGLGMPLSSNGNPDLFGPNSFGCENAPKEKIIITNITPVEFKKGDLALCSQINGSWIPVKLDVPTKISKNISPQWSQIQKYIVDAKCFFRDVDDSSKINPEQYLEFIRTKFYNELSSIGTEGYIRGKINNLIALKFLNLNAFDLDSYNYDNDDKLIISRIPIPSSNKVPSYGYIDVYDADSISIHLGGKSTYKLPSGINKLKTNILQTPFDDVQTNDVFATTVAGSWGMYFPNGYSFSSVSRFKQLNGGSCSSNSNLSVSVYNSGTLNIYNPDIVLDISDSSLYHLPAQIGLNGAANQTLDIAYWVNTFVNTQQFPLNVVNYLQQSIKGDYLTHDNKDVYALTPINGSFVQFTPLSLELALCGTLFDTSSTIVTESQTRNGFLDLFQQIEDTRNVLKVHTDKTRRQDQGDATILGGLFKRLQALNIGLLNITPAGEIKGMIGFSGSLRWPPFNTKGTVSPPNTINSPDGGPGIFPVSNPWWSFIRDKEESNVVGIIGARATVSFGNGQLTLKTNNNFGLTSYTTTGGGGGGLEMTFLGSLGSWFTDTRGQVFNNQRVQWGASSNDDITAFGTTALWCKITDYKKNTIYDARFATPLQFNDSDEKMDFEIPAQGADNNLTILPPGSIVNDKTNVKSMTNAIRRDMLLSGGGFVYIQNIIGANKKDWIIDDPGKDYQVGEMVQFSQGPSPAMFVISQIDDTGGITSIELKNSTGIESLGEFNFNAFYNSDSSEKSGVYASIASQTGQNAEIRLKSGKVLEKLKKDELYESSLKLLTPSDNNGLGTIGRGYVTGSKSTDFLLSGNSSGKYDIFVFFVNDILNYLEGNAGWTYSPGQPYAQYVNLSISSA